MESFDLLVRWLYSARLKNIRSDDDLLVHIALVILANKLCLEHLHNETMDHILGFYRLAPPNLNADTIRSVYWDTSTGNPLRRLVIQSAAWTAVLNEDTDFDGDNQQLLEGGGTIAVDFTTWLARYYATSNGNRAIIHEIDPRRESNCVYHEHDSTPVCSDPFN